jgi:hypothetical protein
MRSRTAASSDAVTASAEPFGEPSANCRELVVGNLAGVALGERIERLDHHVGVTGSG